MIRTERKQAKQEEREREREEWRKRQGRELIKGKEGESKVGNMYTTLQFATFHRHKIDYLSLPEQKHSYSTAERWPT